MSGCCYYCDNRQRAARVRNHPTLNGIDYLEVVDSRAIPPQPRQRVLLVRLLKPLPDPPPTPENIRIDGGVRIGPISVETVMKGTEGSNPTDFGMTAEEAEHTLVVRTSAAGDFSTYTLRLVRSETEELPPEGFDQVLSRIDFSFKVECPSEFDCVDDVPCPPERYPHPQIDYLAKDYNSFRRLMFDRLSLLMPDWKERNPADVGVVIVELLAYTADYLSYYQDAAATEAYLGTARKRASIRRHARLLDYAVHDGCNARTWLCFEVSSEVKLKRIGEGSSGEDSRFSTIPEGKNEEEIIFEPMRNALLRPFHHEIRFHTWGEDNCCLPSGSTRATLKNEHDLQLRKGDVLIFEERRTKTREEGEENLTAVSARYHAVRLTEVRPNRDMLEDPAAELLEIRWHERDALPFPLCISGTDAELNLIEDVTVARGNIVPVDHGLTMTDGALDPQSVPTERSERQRLPATDITFRAPYVWKETFDENEPVSEGANDLLLQDLRRTLPEILLTDPQRGHETWRPQRDLLNSDRFATEFVVEVEEDRTAFLRFGDDVMGKTPAEKTAFKVRYRVGNGAVGNVGAGTITRNRENVSGILRVWNPLPAVGGTDPESIEEVRRSAPAAFRRQQRAVTEEDYVRRAEEHPEVQKAAARFRWTGSWYTVFVTVDRKGGYTTEEGDFRSEIIAWLDQFRIAGYDLEVNDPVFVPLDISMKICVKPGYFRSDIKRELLRVFSRFDLSDGERGFFHPDNFTFGRPLYLSTICARAMNVTGVDSVEIVRMQRWGEEPAGELEAGRLKTDSLEIIRVDNDRNAPENGRIEFTMQGGL